MSTYKLSTYKLNLLALTLVVFATPAAASTISLNPLSAAIPGSSFDVAVRVSGVFATHPGDALAAYGFDVAVGNSLIAFTGETAGTLFTDLSGVFGPSPAVAGFATSGFLVAGDFAEPLTLAILHFFVNRAGSTTIGVNADLRDPNQGLFYAAAGADPLAASLVIGGAAVPEPGTILLVGLAVGLVLLANRRR